MLKFKVTLWRTCFWQTEVEADDEYAAKETAMDMLAENPGDLTELESGDINLSQVEEIA